MKKSFWTIWKLLTHAVLILAVMFGVFFVLDRFNPSMDFINSSLSKALLLVFALLSIVNCVLTAICQFNIRYPSSKKRQQAAAKTGQEEAPSAAEQKDGPLPKEAAPAAPRPARQASARRRSADVRNHFTLNDLPAPGEEEAGVSPHEEGPAGMPLGRGGHLRKKKESPGPADDFDAGHF